MELFAEEKSFGVMSKLLDVMREMRDEDFFILILGFLFHFLLDKIIDCHYTL